MKAKRAPRFFGLTGGIGVGKSSVARAFEKHGVPCLDADQVARTLRSPGKAGHTAILKRFGTDDREKLRAIISQDSEAKRDLEGILHPLIHQESTRLLQEMAEAHPHAPVILYEATLLLEAGRKQDFDSLIVVTAPLEERIDRIIARDKMTRDTALALIKAQNDDEYRLKHAHYVIVNQGSLQDLDQEVRKVLDQIISA